MNYIEIRAMGIYEEKHILVNSHSKLLDDRHINDELYLMKQYLEHFMQPK